MTSNKKKQQANGRRNEIQGKPRSMLPPSQSLAGVLKPVNSDPVADLTRRSRDRSLEKSQKRAHIDTQSTELSLPETQSAKRLKRGFEREIPQGVSHVRKVVQCEPSSNVLISTASQGRDIIAAKAVYDSLRGKASIEDVEGCKQQIAQEFHNFRHVTEIELKAVTASMDALETKLEKYKRMFQKDGDEVWNGLPNAVSSAATDIIALRSKFDELQSDLMDTKTQIQDLKARVKEDLEASETKQNGFMKTVIEELEMRLNKELNTRDWDFTKRIDDSKAEDATRNSKIAELKTLVLSLEKNQDEQRNDYEKMPGRKDYEFVVRENTKRDDRVAQLEKRFDEAEAQRKKRSELEAQLKKEKEANDVLKAQLKETTEAKDRLEAHLAEEKEERGRLETRFQNDIGCLKAEAETRTLTERVVIMGQVHETIAEAEQSRQAWYIRQEEERTTAFESAQEDLKSRIEAAAGKVQKDFQDVQAFVEKHELEHKTNERRLKEFSDAQSAFVTDTRLEETENDIRTKITETYSSVHARITEIERLLDIIKRVYNQELFYPPPRRVESAGPGPQAINLPPHTPLPTFFPNPRNNLSQNGRISPLWQVHPSGALTPTPRTDAAPGVPYQGPQHQQAPQNQQRAEQQRQQKAHQQTLQQQLQYMAGQQAARQSPHQSPHQQQLQLQQQHQQQPTEQLQREQHHQQQNQRHSQHHHHHLPSPSHHPS